MAAETAGTSPAAASVAEWDDLLATKLHVPRPRPGFLPRPRLLGSWPRARDATWSWCAPRPGSARPACSVTGPAAASGRSPARRSQRPVAWLSLDAGDNDPTRFWRYAAAALDGVRPGIGGQVAALLDGPQPSPEAVVTALLNALVTQADRLTLVLDDYHVIDAPPIHHSLGFLLDRLPAQLRVVVASRADPPLPLPRLRARGQLVELRERDLRFTPEETAALLREAGLDLPSASLTALVARTEGWVAGVQLAGLSLHGHADPAGFVASFSGSHRYVLDYLTEEVLDRQPEHLQGVPAGDLGAGTAVGAAVRRRHRRPRQPAAAGADRAGESVPGAAGRGARLVALPPPVRRPAPGPPAADPS
jgi:LuxR family maltose regulon positive regulatory protein